MFVISWSAATQGHEHCNTLLLLHITIDIQRSLLSSSAHLSHTAMGSSSPVQLPADLHNTTDNNNSNSSSTIRLYLVRHGETEANQKKIAAGQMASPLTDIGIQQVTLLRHAMMQHVHFDARVVSDMERTRHTARLLLAQEQEFQLEPRLREMAKGAREGFPKSMSYEEALRQRRDGEEVPKLESDDDVWLRVSDWLVETLRNTTTAVEEESTTTESSSPPPPSNNIHSILTVTHAGVIRTLCAKLVADQLPESVDVSAMGRDGSTQNHLQVPNGSVTVVDFVRRASTADTLLTCNSQLMELFEIKLRLLSWNEHVKKI